MSRPIKNVVVAGATGSLGSQILTELDKHGGFNITVFTRKPDAAFPDGVMAKVVDFSSPTALALALQGQDAVVDALSSPDPSVSIALIDAAVAAGVYRYIAPEFGSDPDNDKTRSLPVFNGKKQVYAHLRQAANQQKITWTAISNGAFLDWGLRVGFVKIDLLKKKIELMNDGTHVFAWTTLPAIATAVANALVHAEKTRNMTCYIYSVQKSQKEIADLAKEALGPDGWETQSKSMGQAFEKALSAVNAGDYSWEFLGDMIRYAISTPGYSTPLEKDHNDLLGVRPMSDEQVKVLIKEISDEMKSGPQ
ncbi:hypothetical protein BJX96DRAFT_184084 [Aspergillus floccosus]